LKVDFFLFNKIFIFENVSGKSNELFKLVSFLNIFVSAKHHAVSKSKPSEPELKSDLHQVTAPIPPKMAGSGSETLFKNGGEGFFYV
jgi:hypothetical protein